MAFLSKVGNILRQTANKQISNECSASRPSLFQAIRFMSSSKLFVGGISYQTDDMSLREAFGKYGEVIEARVILDRETGRSRGFGFVTYTSTEEASSAIQALDGQDLHGRRVRVNYASDRPRGNFGGNFGGGYGAGGGGYGAGGGGYGAGGGGYGAGGGGYGAGGGGYGAGYDNRNSGGNYGVSDGNYGGGNFAAGGEGSVENTGYVAGNEFRGSSGAHGSDSIGGSNLGSYGNAGMEPSGGDDEFGDREGDNLNASAGDFDRYKEDGDTGDFAKRA